MKQTKIEIYYKITSIIMFIMIVIFVCMLIISTPAEETVKEEPIKEESVKEESVKEESVKEESVKEIVKESKLPQETANEINLYNQIVDSKYEANIYKAESSFDYNNLYLPTKEVNPESGKSGLCGLQNSTDNDVWSQDALCEDYMIERYGDWKTAWEFHEQNGWW